VRVNVNDELFINYEISGEGDGVIALTYGMGEAIGTWDPDVPDLSRKYRVLRWDCRGHGESDKPDVPYSAEMHARDLAGLLKAIGIDKVHIGGESMGGAIAQRFLLDYPEMTASGFILCSSSQVSEKMYDAWEARAKLAE
jgi:3-oxoadipate enol-lactonase